MTFSTRCWCKTKTSWNYLPSFCFCKDTWFFHLHLWSPCWKVTLARKGKYGVLFPFFLAALDQRQWKSPARNRRHLRTSDKLSLVVHFNLRARHNDKQLRDMAIRHVRDTMAISHARDTPQILDKNLNEQNSSMLQKASQLLRKRSRNWKPMEWILNDFKYL